MEYPVDVLALKSDEEALYAVTRSGKLYRFDGESWHKIKVPNDLLQRWVKVELEWNGVK